jgi:hypothetical protein
MNAQMSGIHLALNMLLPCSFITVTIGFSSVGTEGF